MTLDPPRDRDRPDALAGRVDLGAADTLASDAAVASAPGSLTTELARVAHKLVAELRVARTFRDDIAAALAPGRMRGADGPDGVSTREVIADVVAALERFDQGGTTR